MQDGILFYNILIAKDEKVAETYRQTTWKPKFDVEKEKKKKKRQKRKLPALQMVSRDYRKSSLI